MTQLGAGLPPGWLEPGVRTAATDLDLVVLLLNSMDHLEDPPDRLHDLRWFRGVLAAVGHETLADQLLEDDLGDLRTLRGQLQAVFELTDDEPAAALLNPLLIRHVAVPLLTPDGAGGTALQVGVDRVGFPALAARLVAALASFVAARGVQRLGTCNAGPCSCAYVDRTRGRTRRYCCIPCNDRAAARSYRARRREDPPSTG